MNKKTDKKIKVSFPHMGTIYVAWEKALNAVGVEAFIPPYTSKKTLSLGTKNSPEAICLPYKLILGNFIEAIEGGADFVSMIASPGICRLGEYGRNIEQVLIELGYKTNYIELNLYDGFKGMIDYLKRISGCNNYLTIMNAIYLAVRTVFAVDELQNFLSYHRAREVKKGETITLYESTGKTAYTIENYVGKNVDAVKAILETNYGLNVVIEKMEVDKDKEYGEREIVKQDLKVGEEVSRGTNITFKPKN